MVKWWVKYVSGSRARTPPVCSKIKWFCIVQVGYMISAWARQGSKYIKMIIHSKPFCFPASYAQFSIHTQYARLSRGPLQKIGTSMGEWHHSDQPVPKDENSWGRKIGCISILLGVATETSHSFQERNIFKGLTFQLAVCISSHVFHWKQRIFSCFNCVIYFQHIFPWLYLSHIFSHLFFHTCSARKGLL